MMGVVFAFWEVVTVSLRQAIVSDQLIGRVVSAYRLLGYGAIPLGAVLGGVLGRTFGLRAPFVLGAVVLAAMALLVAPVVNTRSIQAARAATDSQRLAQSADS